MRDPATFKPAHVCPESNSNASLGAVQMHQLKKRPCSDVAERILIVAIRLFALSGLILDPAPTGSCAVSRQVDRKRPSRLSSSASQTRSLVTRSALHVRNGHAGPAGMDADISGLISAMRSNPPPVSSS